MPQPLSKREQMLVSLLRVQPRTGAELADALAVSRRTVVREVASVNARLEAEGAGRIDSEPSYRLEVLSDERLSSLLRDALSDELAVLLAVLTEREQNLATLGEVTFLSRRAIQTAIAEINRDFDGVLRLEPRAGRSIGVELAVVEAPDVLASLAAESAGAAVRLGELAGGASGLALVEGEEAAYRDAMTPHLSSRQVRLQTVAAMAAARASGDSGAASRARGARALYREKRELHERLLASRDEIEGEISSLLRVYGIQSERSDLASLVFGHVVRCALFPTLTTDEMSEQMRDMRLRHPFEFDFGDDLCSRLRQGGLRLLMDPGFLAMYLLASTERSEGVPVSVLVLCHRRSMSAINRRLIEQSVERVRVRVVCGDSEARRALEEGPWDLLVRDEDAPTSLTDVSWDMGFRGVLGTDDLKVIKGMATDILYRKNLARMLSEESYFRLENKSGQLYLTVLEDVLGTLVGAHRITEQEAGLIRRRERAGNRLSLAGIAFPHAITPVESSEFRLFVVRLAEPVEDTDSRIQLVVVVLASQSQNDKSSIFAYLLSAIEGATLRGLPLPDGYEETVRYLTKDASGRCGGEGL